MNVSCPKCETVFRVDPAKVPVRGIRARCSSCSAVFFVGRPTEPSAVTPPATRTAIVAPEAEAPSWPVAQPVPQPVWTPAPAPATAAPPAARPAVTPPAGAGFGSSPAPSLHPAAAPPPPAVGPRARATTGAVGGGTPAYTAPAPAGPLPPAAPPLAPRPAAAAAPPQRKPVNPFLATDPSTKARRLARALISDLVVYHPAKRADGIRDGTLKLLFEEEIRKCWEEYTEQVGLEMATSTAYFTEALNQILADGQPVFS